MCVCVHSVVSNSLQPCGLVTHQATPSMGFLRQEHWSGLPFPSQGIIPTQRSDQCLLCLLHWQVSSFPLSHLGARSCHRRLQITPGWAWWKCLMETLLQCPRERSGLRKLAWSLPNFREGYKSPSFPGVEWEAWYDYWGSLRDGFSCEIMWWVCT